MTKILLTLAVVSAVVAIWRFWKLPEPPIRRVSTRTELFCFDCDIARARLRAGGGLPEDGDYLPVPHKTFLTPEDRCDGCGGKAFVLASLYAPLWAAKIKRRRCMGPKGAEWEAPVYVERARERKEEGYGR